MTDTTQSEPKTLRLDPAPSKAFTWLLWQEAAEAVVDERGRTIQPEGPCLTVRYRTTGLEVCSWPVSEQEARRVMQPGPEFDYSIGQAFNAIVKAVGKSGRKVKMGERQETRKQRDEVEQRAGRRWLA